MIDQTISASAVAHTIHYTVLAVGLVGLVVLIGPQLGRRPESAAPQDEHARRVAQLDEQIAAGTLGRALTPFPATLAVAAPAASGAPERPDLSASMLVPVAVLSSAAAAAVHAAVGPDHFRERFLFGVFFAAASLCQVAWSLLVALRPRRWLVEAAVVGNLVAIALWLVTRTVGLGSLLPTPESLGPWDLSCVCWELVTVLSCAALLRSPDLPRRMPSWTGWDRVARAWAIGSVIAYVALWSSGAGA